MLRNLLTSLAISILVSSAAKADIVFEGGLPNFSQTGQANDLSLGILAQSFVLNDSIQVTGIDFWTFGSKVETGINYYFYNDSNGQPGDQLNFSNLSAVTITDLGVDAIGIGDDYQYSITFNNPVDFLSNTKYWLGLNINTDPSNIGWFTTILGSNSLGLTDFTQYSPNDSNFWITLEGVQQAFQLEGNMAVAAPEPKYMTVALGIGAIFICLRRKLK